MCCQITTQIMSPSQRNWWTSLRHGMTIQDRTEHKNLKQSKLTNINSLLLLQVGDRLHAELNCKKNAKQTFKHSQKNKFLQFSFFSAIVH